MTSTSSSHQINTKLRWLWSTNAKDIGTIYLASAIICASIGTALSDVIILQLANPGAIYLSGNGQLYNTVITAHALAMIFFFIIPTLMGAFANYLVPLQLGAVGMSFPFSHQQNLNSIERQNKQLFVNFYANILFSVFKSSISLLILIFIFSKQIIMLPIYYYSILNTKLGLSCSLPKIYHNRNTMFHLIVHAVFTFFLCDKFYEIKNFFSLQLYNNFSLGYLLYLFLVSYFFHMFFKFLTYYLPVCLSFLGHLKKFMIFFRPLVMVGVLPVLGVDSVSEGNPQPDNLNFRDKLALQESKQRYELEMQANRLEHERNMAASERNAKSWRDGLGSVVSMVAGAYVAVKTKAVSKGVAAGLGVKTGISIDSTPNADLSLRSTYHNAGNSYYTFGSSRFIYEPTLPSEGSPEKAAPILPFQPSVEPCNTLSYHDLESAFAKSKLREKFIAGGKSDGRGLTTSNFNDSTCSDMNSEAASGLFFLDNLSFSSFFQLIFKNLSVRISSVVPQSIKSLDVNLPSSLGPLNSDGVPELFWQYNNYVTFLVIMTFLCILILSSLATNLIFFMYKDTFVKFLSERNLKLLLRLAERLSVLNKALIFYHLIFLLICLFSMFYFNISFFHKPFPTLP